MFFRISALLLQCLVWTNCLMLCLSYLSPVPLSLQRIMSLYLTGMLQWRLRDTSICYWFVPITAIWKTYKQTSIDARITLLRSRFGIQLWWGEAAVLTLSYGSFHFCTVWYQFLSWSLESPVPLKNFQCACESTETQSISCATASDLTA